MLAILNSLNAHNLPNFQLILMALVSKFMVHRALSDKTYLSLGSLSPLKTIIHYIKQNDQNYAIISLDQEKAIDRLEHNFLKIVLKKFYFPDNFIKWFSILYTDIESKILVNGTFTSTFKIKRSVRQGCSLSMFLYALGLEPLIFKINSNPNIQGISIPNTQKETKSLQHADEIIVIIKNKKSFSNLNKETKKYSENSGSKINQDKTEILTFGNWDDLKNQIQKIYSKIK